MAKGKKGGKEKGHRNDGDKKGKDKKDAHSNVAKGESIFLFIIHFNYQKLSYIYLVY